MAPQARKIPLGFARRDFKGSVIQSLAQPTPWSRLLLGWGRVIGVPPPAPSRAYTMEVYVTSQAREGDFNFIFNRIFKGAVAPLDPCVRWP